MSIPARRITVPRSAAPPAQPLPPLVDRVESGFQSMRPGRAILSALAAFLWLVGYLAGLIFRVLRAGLNGPVWAVVAIRIGFSDAAQTRTRRNPP